tara:strand:- start:627 stop:1190 length:564 start_codon:yes stop_codon:yes gene_type:complete
MEKLVVLCAIPEEVEGLYGKVIHFTGVGKINAAAETEKIINDSKPGLIINYGTAGAVNKNISGLVEVTGFVDRDMDATPLNFKLGQTPYETDVMIGKPGIICASGDTFATSKPKIECDIVDMEAYAIAKICKKHKVDFKCYKYISDSADSKASKDWLKNITKGCTIFNKEVLEKIKMPTLIELTPTL